MTQFSELFYNLSLYLLILSTLLSFFLGSVDIRFLGSKTLWHLIRRYVVVSLLTMVILSAMLVAAGLLVTLDFSLLFTSLGLNLASVLIFFLFTNPAEK
ncbi:MAG TPA: hypothetical protein VGA21_11555 [Cyclobacteriaceae bacterium]